MRDVLTRPRPHAGIRNILPAALAVLLVLGGAFAGEPT